jgi:hydrogenase-4 component B
MDALWLALLLQGVGGTAAFLASRSPRAATLLGAGGALAGCLVALPPALRVLLGGETESARFAWDQAHGAFRVELDALSAFFLVPVLGLSALAAVYGASYLFAYRRDKSLGSPWFFFNAFVAGMTMVLLARTTLLFLLAWEVMSIAAFCLVTFEHGKADVRQAGWIYLIATHLGVIFLILAFLLLGRHAGSLEFAAFGAMPAPSAGWAGLVFVLALIGFGAKAGLFPFHVWLPEAHPAAPSHVSALMSGVMIKMGLYGMLRMLSFLGAPAAWWGLTLAGLGLATALAGIALAAHQRDLKRVLAYSSIENMGLIAVALGVGLWGGARGLPTVALLGTTAALLHLWNHALMKGMMFFAAGSVVHGAGDRDMEQLGGLMKRMPWTGAAMMVGAVAIAALPPLNGFVSKWLMYLSLMQFGLSAGDGQTLIALLAVGILALIGGLAALAFVRLTGIVLLGSPRSEAAAHAQESSPWMLAPIYILACLCLASALVPATVVELTFGPLTQILGRDAGRAWLDLEVAEAPLAVIGDINAWTLLALLAAAVVLVALTKADARGLSGSEPAPTWSRRGPTWGCGYARPTSRMQYTGRSFVQMLAEHLLPRFLRPRTRREAPRGLFPSAGEFDSASPDPVRDKVYEPFFRRWADRFTRLRILQQGKVHVYLVYIMVVVVAALAWASLRTWWWGAS